MAPPWFPADAFNGRSATEPKALRSMPQWASIFLRYAPMAAAVGQLPMPSALAYMATVMKLAETERLAKTPGWIAIQYDAALRKSWARRILQGDPDLDIPQECLRINEDVLEAVRVQVNSATSGSKTSSSASGPASSSWSDAAAEGAIAKVGAAAQAMTRRAEAASRELANAEQRLASREVALHGQTLSGGKKGTGGKAGSGKNSGKRQGQNQGGGKKKWYRGW